MDKINGTSFWVGTHCMQRRCKDIEKKMAYFSHLKYSPLDQIY